MRRPSTAPLFLLCLGLGAVAWIRAESAGPAKPPSPPARPAVEKTLEGHVREFAAGRRLTVETDEGKALTYRLDERDLEVNVPSALGAGTRVRVVESRQPDGRRAIDVTVVPAAAGKR